MEYKTFERLVGLSFRLKNRRHIIPPSERPGIEKAIYALDERLRSDPEYDSLLKRYAREAKRIG